MGLLKNSYYWKKHEKKKYLLLFETKLIKKYPVLAVLKNTINHFWEMNKELMKQPEIITYQPKSTENPDIIHIKSVTVEHPKTSSKLS